MASEKIDGRVGRDPGEPVRCLLLVLELLLPLQCFDEGFLCEILSVRHIPDNPVNLNENTPQIVGNKPVLPLQSLERRGD